MACAAHPRLHTCRWSRLWRCAERWALVQGAMGGGQAEADCILLQTQSGLIPHLPGCPHAPPTPPHPHHRSPTLLTSCERRRLSGAAWKGRSRCAKSWGKRQERKGGRQERKAPASSRLGLQLHCAAAANLAAAAGTCMPDTLPAPTPAPPMKQTPQGLRDQVAQRRAEADKEAKRRERAEREMKDLVCAGGGGG